MQGKFATLGADSPISQLAGVIRGSASQGNSRNSSANNTPLASPRNDQPSRRSSNGSKSSSSLSTPQGTPPRSTHHISKKDTSPIASTRLFSQNLNSSETQSSQPIPILARRPRNTSEPTTPITSSEDTTPTPPVRRESLNELKPSNTARSSSFRSVTFAAGQLAHPIITGSSPELLQRRDSNSMRDRVLEKKRTSIENKFTIPDIISFSIFGQEYVALQDKETIHKIIILMEFLGYMTEELYMKQFNTRAEACTTLKQSMQSPICIPPNEFKAKANSIRAVLTPRIVIVDSGEDKLSELQANVNDLLNNPNFLPLEISFLQTKISSRTIQTTLNIEPEVFSEVRDYPSTTRKTT